MKKIYFILLITAAFLGCEDKLVEENHSKLTPEFFKTQAGFEYGLNSAYSGLRSYYGPEEGIEAFTVGGTDEFFAPNGSRPTNVDNYNSSFTPSNEFSKRMWNTAYTMINTCNGLVDFGSAMTGIPEAEKKRMLAEAKFLRAFYYFKLVQFFGDATLNKNYLSSPSTSATRDSKADIYNFIIEDLQVCITDLPASPLTANVKQGKATVAAAKHMLSLVYLTRGWSDAAQPGDFQSAFDMAKSLIDESAAIGVGLLDNFADVFKAKNENNKEVLFNVQYSNDLTYGGNHPMNHLFITGYHVQVGNRSVEYGRPFVWYRGTTWLYTNAFPNREIDTRYSKTFQNLWLANISDRGFDTKVVHEFTINGTKYSKEVKFRKGDTALYMPGYNLPPEKLLSKNYYVFTPEIYSNTAFPSMTKFMDPNRLTPNENSYRPIIVYRFAETYLVAAEAALKSGKPDVAAEYVNIVRRRAGVVGNKSLMDVSASDITVDFLLDERTREFCGENMRWLDLVRTGKLIERIKKYDTWEAYKNIQEKHILRPVPQDQINAVITGTPYPQNPGWDN